MGDAVGVLLRVHFGYKPLGDEVGEYLVDGLFEILISVIDELKLEKISEEEKALDLYQNDIRGLYKDIDSLLNVFPEAFGLPFLIGWCPGHCEW